MGQVTVGFAVWCGAASAQGSSRGDTPLAAAEPACPAPRSAGAWANQRRCMLRALCRGAPGQRHYGKGLAVQELVVDVRGGAVTAHLRM